MTFSAKYCASLLIWVVFSVTPQVSFAQNRTIVVGFTEFSPYSFTNEAGRVTGYAPEVIRKASKRFGAVAEFRRYPNLAVLLSDIESGVIDMSVFLAMTSARREIGTFTDAIGSFTVDLTFAGEIPTQAYVEDLSGLRIAVNKGAAPDRLLERYEGVERVYLNTVEDRLFALVSGRVDAVIGPTFVFRKAAKEAGLAARLASETLTLDEYPRGFLVSDSALGLVDELNAALRSMTESGELEATRTFWMGGTLPTLRDRLEQYVLTIVAAFAVAFIALAGSLLVFVVRRRIERRDAIHRKSMADALDAARTGILVFDEQGKVQVSNIAFVEAFPKLEDDVLQGAFCDTVVAAAQGHGYLPRQEGGEAAVSSLTALFRDADAPPLETLLRGKDDRSFACFGSRLNDGRVALVTTDVTELEESRQAIESKATELKSANKHLGTFARVAAHDLKSPAASTATLLDWISEDLAEAGVTVPQNVNEALDRARTLLQRQVALIEDLLAYARTASSAGASQVVDPTERLASIVALIDLPDGFTFEAEEPMVKVVADPAAFDLVIRNLLSNAVKHHDRDTGHIALRCEKAEDGKVSFWVEDDGPGIAGDVVDRVFEPFFRSNYDEETPGSGLGLSVIKSAIDSWGGDVSVSARHPRGTRVAFTIPCAKDLPEAKRPAQKYGSGRAASA